MSIANLSISVDCSYIFHCNKLCYKHVIHILIKELLHNDFFSFDTLRSMQK